MRDWLERCLARVHGPSGVEGGGLLIGPRHVVTCAHVVAAALGDSSLEMSVDPPAGSLTVSFPAVAENTSTACVAPGGWREVEADLRGDMAVLELTDPAPPACSSPPLLCPPGLDGHGFFAKGFPPDTEAEYPGGVRAEGRVSGTTGPGDEWRQLIDYGYLIQPGFSGAPVWDRVSGAVVGIVVARDHRWVEERQLDTEAAFMIPLPVLIETWGELEGKLGWRARFDPQRDLHWGPRSRGLERHDEKEPGQFFTGRRRVLGELAGWLAERPDGRARVVTGRAGAGKSAVLARLVMVADPDEEVGLETDCAALHLAPIDAAIVSREDGNGLTLDQIVARIARWTDTEAETAEELVAALEKTVVEGGQAPAIVIDQLDEAARPAELIALLLAPLAEAGAAHVLVGLSKEDGDALLSEFGEAAEELDLDEEYFDEGDLREYVAELLARGDPYRDDPEARERVAAEVAEQARPLFLVAQLVALDLAEEADIAGPLPPQAYPRSVDVAMSRYVSRIATRASDDGAQQEQLRTRVLDLMGALAYAQGAGLPLTGETWPAVATALGDREYDRESVEWLWGTAARFVMQRETVAGVTYGHLFHAALAGCLKLEEEDAAVHRRIADALAGLCPEGSATPAPPYVESHLSRHTLLAGEDAWRELAARPAALDRLEPLALRADVRRAALRGDGLPAEMLGVLNSGHLMAESERGDRAGLRQLGMARIGDRRSFSTADSTAALAEWTVASAVLRRQTPHATIQVGCGVRALTSVADRDGSPLLLAGCEDHTVRAWEAATGEPAGAALSGDSQIRALAACRVDGRPSVAVGDESGWVRTFNPEAGSFERFPSGHLGGVRALAAFAVAGVPHLATAGDDDEVRLWSWRGDPGARLSVGGPVRALTAAVSGERVELVAGTDDGRLAIWRLGPDELGTAGGAVEPEILEGPTDWIRAVSLWGEGAAARVAAGGDDGGVYLWSGSPTADPAGSRLNDPGQPVLACVAFALSGGGYRLASAGADSAIRLWGDDGEQIGAPLRGHSGPVCALTAYEVDGAVGIASAGDDGVRIWDPAGASGPPPTGAFHRHPVVAVAACRTSRGALAVTGDEEGNVRLWDPDTGRHRTAGFNRHGAAVRVIVPYPDGDVETAVATGGDEEVVRFSDAATGQGIDGLTDLRGHAGPVRALSFESEEAAIVSGGEDGTVRVWSPEHEEIVERASRPGPPVRGVQPLLLPGHGHCLAIVGPGRGIEIRLASDPTEVVYSCEAHADWTMAVVAQARAVAPRIVTCGDDGAVWAYDPLAGDRPELLGSHDAPVRALATLGRDMGSLIATGGDDGTVRLWDPDAEPAARRCLRIGGRIHAICELEGRLLAGTDEGHVVIDLGRG